MCADLNYKAEGEIKVQRVTTTAALPAAIKAAGSSVMFCFNCLAGLGGAGDTVIACTVAKHNTRSDTCV